MATFSGQIQIRHDTAQNWASKNTVLLTGEQGYEEDTGRIKVGDGTTTWNNLPYLIFNSSNQLEFPDGTLIWIE